MTFTLFINLFLGNLIIFGRHGKYETTAGIVMIHLLATLVAIYLLTWLFKRFAKKTKIYKIVLLSTLTAYLVPVLTIYLSGFIYAVYSLQFDGILKTIPYAIIGGIVSWSLWLPFAIVNSILFFIYSNHTKH